MGESASQMTHHRVRETDEPGGDVADVHNLAGEHEERDCEQRKLVDSREHPLGQDLEEYKLFGQYEPRERREDEGEHDWHAGCDGGEKDEDEGARQVGSRLSPLRGGYCHPLAAPGAASPVGSSGERIESACRSISSSETISMIADPIGTARKM